MQIVTTIQHVWSLQDITASVQASDRGFKVVLRQPLHGFVLLREGASVGPFKFQSPKDT